VSTTIAIFPFDLFGSAGTGQGAEQVAEAFREILADNRRERVPTRALAYSGKVRLRECSFVELSAYQDWRKRGRQVVRQSWHRDEFLLWITGNHLGALPIYDELAGTENLVVQFDAHLDIHHFSDCTPELSHGNFLLHCAEPLPPLCNIGHRELLLQPDYINNYYQMTFPADALALDPEPALRHLRKACQRAPRVFLDIDCDVFDPTFFPAVSEPVPFGLTPLLFLRLLDAAWSGRVAGVALSEYNPSRDRDDTCLATLMWLLEYLLLRRYELH
jgi:arginase family enzyme